MLLGIDPVLTGDLLAALDRLGHGESMLIADANYPAHRGAGTVIELPGLSSPRVLRAVVSVLPIDTYEGPAVGLMAPEPGAGEPVQSELRAASGVSEERINSLERFAFYDAAAGLPLVVRTGEGRSYGNVLLRVGVVPAPAEEAG